MNMPTMRDVGLCIASSAAGGAAILSAAATHSVDLYAFYDQLGVVWGDLVKLGSLALPIATWAAVAWNARPRKRAADVAEDPKVKGIVAPEYASIPNDKVQATVKELPVEAKKA